MIRRYRAPVSLHPSDLPKAWRPVDGDQAAQLVASLRREVPDGHLLHGRTVHAVAKCSARDEAVFAIDDLGLYAVVHLTYRAESDPRWPSVLAVLPLAHLRWFLLILDPG
jgi:hypothetical protein